MAVADREAVDEINDLAFETFVEEDILDGVCDEKFGPADGEEWTGEDDTAVDDNCGDEVCLDLTNEEATRLFITAPETEIIED